MTPEAFNAAVKRGEPDECWPWTAATNPHGYGTISEKPKMVRAHRRAYEYAHGLIPDGLSVLHSCDNPPCCNPAHLFLGTHEDNMRDMFAKGRRIAAVGEKNGRARLTAETVREARRNYTGKSGEVKALCARLGVHKNTMLAALHGKTWKHV